MNLYRHSVVYFWGGWHDYLLPSLIDKPTLLEASPADSAETVYKSIPKKITAFFFHLDFSWTENVPKHRYKLISLLLRDGIRPVNAACTNISKHHVQETWRRHGLPSLTAKKDGDPDELLIVKTNANCAGLTPLALQEQGWQVDVESEYRHRICQSKDYRVMSRKDLRDTDWMSPDLVVERYISNCEHIIYRAYICLEQLIVSEVVDPSPVKKLPTGAPRTDYYGCVDRGIENGPDRVRLVASIACSCSSILGLDYGALDIAMDESGTPYVIDVNTTPWWGEPDKKYFTDYLRKGFS